MSVDDLPLSEYVSWCRERAYAELEAGNYALAIASLYNDLGANPKTARHPAIAIGMMLQTTGRLDDAEAVAAFIDGIR